MLPIDPELRATMEAAEIKDVHSPKARGMTSSTVHIDPLPFYADGNEPLIYDEVATFDAKTFADTDVSRSHYVEVGIVETGSKYVPAGSRLSFPTTTDQKEKDAVLDSAARSLGKIELCDMMNEMYEENGIRGTFTPTMLSALASARIRKEQKAKRKNKRR